MKKKVFAAVALVALAGCRSRNAEEAVILSGTLEMTEHKAGARTNGRILHVLTEEGQHVEKGQLLAQLDRYEQTRRDYSRAQENMKTGGATEQSVEQAHLAMEDQQVISPVDGVVLTQIYQEGEIIPSGGAVLIIGDEADLWVRVYVPENKINRVHIGESATVHFDGLTETYEGKVTFVAAKAEFTPRNVQTPEERVLQVFAVKVRIENPAPSLRPGVAADVDLKLAPS